MPNPKSYKTEKDFMAACIPVVLKEGTAKSNDQAVAVCSSMWQHRSKTKGSQMDALDHKLPEELTGVLTFDADSSNAQNSESCSTGTASSDMALAGTSQKTSASVQGEKPKTREQQTMADNTDIRKEVEAIMAEKDAAAKVEARISTLQTEKDDLSSRLEAAEAAKKTLSTELESVKAEKTSATEKVEALETDKTKLNETVATLQGELGKIRADQVLAARTTELTEASLLKPEGDKRVAQLEKVRAMSDDDFASYKQDLLDVAEMAKAAVSTKTETETQTSTEEGDKTQAKTETGEEAGDTTVQKTVASQTPPPDLSHGDIYRKAVAAISTDVQIDEDMVDQYAQM